MELKHREIKKLTATIYLDDYDDIFSDFDYGAYETRRLSEDLLFELEQQLRGVRSAKLDLVFVLPDKARQKNAENLVRKRLKQAFAYRQRSAQEELNGYKRSGAQRISLGILVLALEWFLIYNFEAETVFTLLGTIIAPAGWFGAFTGLEKFFDIPKETIEKQSAYQVLSGSSISFTGESKLVAKEEFRAPQQEQAKAKPLPS